MKHLFEYTIIHILNNFVNITQYNWEVTLGIPNVILYAIFQSAHAPVCNHLLFYIENGHIKYFG